MQAPKGFDSLLTREFSLTNCGGRLEAQKFTKNMSYYDQLFEILGI